MITFYFDSECNDDPSVGPDETVAKFGRFCVIGVS